MIATIVHNGGLVMGMGAVIIALGLIAFWPEQPTVDLVDWEKEGWFR